MLSPRKTAEPKTLAALKDGQLTAEASYNFYGITVKIRSDSEKVVSSLDSVYRFFRVPSSISHPHLELALLVNGAYPPGGGEGQVLARVPASFDGWRTALLNRIGPASVWRKITGHIQKIDTPPSQSEAGRHLYSIEQIETWYIDWTAGIEFLIFHFLMYHLARFGVVHAAAVCRAERGLLLTGPPDSGKSVLAYALVRQGFRYLSDEYGLFDPVSLEMLPFPRGISFKPEVVHLFPELDAILDGRDVVWRQEKRHLVSLANLGFRVTEEPSRAAFLFFVSHRASALPQLTRLPAAAAAERLLSTRNLWVISSEESRSFTRSEAAAQLCENVKCYELLSGELDKTVELICSMVAGEPLPL